MPIDDYTLDSLRDNISLVSQDVVLFNDTIANNLAYGKLREHTDAELQRVATVAHIRDFTDEMPNGLDTRVGDRGMLLPGYAADLMLFDPATVGPGSKRVVADMPGGEARYLALPRGFVATIVNGEPIVEDGKLTSALPGQLLRGRQQRPRKLVIQALRIAHQVLQRRQLERRNLLRRL